MLSRPPKIAIIVLNYNTPLLTDALAAYLTNDLHYTEKHVYVIDNGSDQIPTYVSQRLSSNVGFTRGMYEGYRFASGLDSYEAYWFLNSDVGFEYGDDVLSNLVDVLFSRKDYAQISPQCNSPHKFMERAEQEAQPVPYLEPTATLIRASTIERVGFWDLDLSHGWGVDYDYGYRVRQAGLVNVLTNRARIVHKEHRSITNWSAFVDTASSEMHTVLTRKYGPGWERINKMRRIIPVLLMCDRDLEVTQRFTSSFGSVRHALEKPVVVVDISSSPKLSLRFLNLLQSIEPQVVLVHPRRLDVNIYESIQDAADYALAGAVELGGENDLYLFVEDDVIFSSRFVDCLNSAQLGEQAGFLTFYLPGNGYEATEIDPNQFYGTQCVLFPRHSVELIVREREEMCSKFPPGYDIRWSRFLSAKGYRLYATDHSYVQHLSMVSRLHGHLTHASNRFLP